MNTQTTSSIPKLFIGMDVHKKSWTCHFKTDLFDHKTITMPADADCLIEYVQKHFSDHQVTCCYEAGCCGYWIARRLLQLDWKVLVVNPADVPRTSKQGWQKTDKTRCRNLCHQLQQNNLHSIRIPEQEQEGLRSLLRRRNHLIRQLHTIKNHIKSQLLYYGIKVPEEYDNPNWSYQMKDWLLAIEWKFSTASLALGSRLKQLHFLWYEALDISTALRAYAGKALQERLLPLKERSRHRRYHSYSHSCLAGRSEKIHKIG